MGRGRERVRERGGNTNMRYMLNEGAVSCAAWLSCKSKDNEDLVVLAKPADRESEGGGAPAGILEIASYNYKCHEFVSKGNLVLEGEEDGNIPVSMAAHPGGYGLVLSFSKSCKYFELDEGKSELKVSDKILSALLGVGPQKCLLFSADGCKLAAGGDDGHLRVFEWPSMQVLLDKPAAQTSFKDLDFSLDSAYLASTSDVGPARVWDIVKAIPLTTLSRDQSESIELCRFSRDGTKPFLFCTVKKGGKTNTTVWDMTTWKKLGMKKFFDKPTSAFDISSNGKFLALGSVEGNICVVDVQKMQVQRLIKRAHVGAAVTSIEFSSNGRALLSVSDKWAARINPIHCEADWKDWQIYLVLLAMFLVSAVLFYIFFEYSDSFWNFPLGREQPARPPIEAILGDPISPDDQNIW